MPGRVEDLRGEVAQRKNLLVGKAMIELPAVGCKVLTQIEKPGKAGLHLRDALADGGGGAEAGFKKGERTHVIGMGVGLEQPVHAQPFGLDHRDELLGGLRAAATRVRIVIEHRVDDRRPAGCHVPHHVRKGMAGRMKNRSDDGLHDWASPFGEGLSLSVCQTMAPTPHRVGGFRHE